MLTVGKVRFEAENDVKWEIIADSEKFHNFTPNKNSASTF